MTETSRVKILEAKYEEEKDLFVWKLRFLEKGNTEQSFCWPSVDLLSALGIKSKAAPELLREFCENMTGKEINFVVGGEPVAPEAGTSEDYKSVTNAVSEHFDNFSRHISGEQE